LECELDGLDYAVEVGADIGVPESQRAEASSSKDGVAHRVMLNLPVVVSVLTPIDLYDQALLEADEVEIEAEQRRLAAKVEAVATHQP
jgi:hypothetical protein